MAGACSCESCLGKACGRPAGALEAFEAGQTAGLNALKNRWLGRVAARVALERPAEALEGFDKRSEKQNAVAERPAGALEAFDAGQTAGWNALKNRWLGRAAARVALERPADALEAFEAGQTAGLNALKNRWLRRVAARVALERPAEALEAFVNALKNRWLGRVAARVALERPAEALEGFDKRSEKQNAVAERPAGALEAFEAGQTAGLNALKNRWLGRVAARVALERPCGSVGRFDKRSEKQNAVTGVAPEWNGLGQGRAMAVKKQVPHLWWYQAPPLPWLRQGSADSPALQCGHVTTTSSGHVTAYGTLPLAGI